MRGFIPALALPKARIIRKLRGAMWDRRKHRPSPLSNVNNVNNMEQPSSALPT